jgi:hypothetical protein
MTWINTNESTLKFIKEITKHSYQDDDSFFSSWIDKYYHLNFIEMNRQLNSREEEFTFFSQPFPEYGNFNQDSKDNSNLNELNEQVIPNYLSTGVKERGQFNYISNLELESSQGDILKKEGYFKKIYYYDHTREVNELGEKFVDFFVAPLKNERREKVGYLIPQDENLSKSSTLKWMEINYGNTHRDWEMARLLNYHNLNELNKLNLKARVEGINFQVIRGMSIPTLVSLRVAEQILKSNESNLSDSSELYDEVLDKTLSDFYVVKGIKYYYSIFEENQFYTEILLTKRNWF